MTLLLEPGSKLTLLAEFHDRLGWESFVEGMICKLRLVARNTEIVNIDLHTTSAVQVTIVGEWFVNCSLVEAEGKC